MFIRSGKRVCPSCAHKATHNRTVLNSHTFDKGVETYKTTVVAETINIDIAALIDNDQYLKDNTICINCGMDFGSAEKTKKAGCSECFDSFHEQFIYIMRRLDRRLKIANERTR